MKKTSRRKFITHGAAIGIGSVLAAPAFANLLAADHSLRSFDKLNDTGFDQTPLAYATTHWNHLSMPLQWTFIIISMQQPTAKI